VGRLGAKGAIFRALTGFCVNYAAKDDLPSFEMLPYFGGRSHNLEGVVSASDKEVKGIIDSKAIILKGLIFQFINYIQ
jgi:hypothetical protein